MTDDLLPPASPDDELVSAVLDGEATDADRARVAADPRLQARLVELREVRDAVAGPVLVDDAAREAGLAAALAAASEAGGLLASGSTNGTDGQAPGDPPAGQVVDLSARRRTRLAVAAAAVAAVVVLAVVVPLAIGRTSTEKYAATGAAVDDAAAPRSTVAGSGGAASRSGSAEASPDGGAGPPAPNAAAGRAPTTTASALPLATIPPDSPAVVAASYLGDDLGTVTTPDEVHDRVEARFNATRQDVHAGGGEHPQGEDADPGKSTSAGAAPGTYLPPEAQREIVLRLQACDPVIRAAEPGLGVTIFTAGLVYQEVPALVFLYDGPPTATNRLVTVDRATCSVLDRQPSPF